MTPDDFARFADEYRQPKSFSEFCYNRGYTVDPEVYSKRHGERAAEHFLVTYLTYLTEYTEYRFDCLMAMVRE